ncbi:MAG: hypothetical protein AAF251_14325 [Pseudomonadota bacterium]
MMSEASFASLGPTLLARKGGAKPAMRPQLTPLPDDFSEMAALADEQLEDLGWNDMGADSEAEDMVDAKAPVLSNRMPSVPQTFTDEPGADVVPLNPPAARAVPANEDNPTDRDPTDSPLVASKPNRSARDLIADAAEAFGEPKKPKKRAKKTGPSGRRAAFTLRLDTERHLKLRLAATMQGVSAQSLVTEALDAMLDGMEELDLLVDRVKRD